MTKELEALEFICKILKEKGIDIKWLFKEQYNTIKQRLESIEDSNPSEALGCLHTIAFNTQINGMNFGDELRTIKQALIKLQEDEEENKFLYNTLTTISKQYTDLMLEYQEQKKVLEIINEKGLPLIERDMIKQSKDYDEYNIKYSWCNLKNASIQKTKEEFELLKEVLK